MAAMPKFSHLIDLAAVRLGGKVLAANDDFFAPKENLLKREAPVFIPDKYTDRGKWMDGWETRRRRTPGHDWCIVALGLPGVIRSIIVDTAFFRGNFPSQCSIDACGVASGTDASFLTSAEGPWQPLVGYSELSGDAQTAFAIDSPHRFTHVRLNIFPDGGVARLRVLGEALPDWRHVFAAGKEIDLASVVHGAHVVDTSDRFFGEPANMLMPYPAANMGDGWETKRRRGPGHDWVVIRLGTEGTITRVELDTARYKGNYPENASLEVAAVEEIAGTVSADRRSIAIGDWKPLLEEAPLQPDHLHVFESELAAGTTATHVRLNIFPDGGVSRLRLFGLPTVEGRRRAVIQLLNAMTDTELLAALADYCAAPGWIARMAGARPYSSAAALLAAADKAAEAIAPDDWLEAFRHHPRIGEARAERAQSRLAANASAGEQAAVSVADQHDLEALASDSRAYEDRFGYVFIISAAGKTAPEIRAALTARLKNDAATELPIAVAEQRRIMRLRLEKLLG
jgi:allantoicase